MRIFPIVRKIIQAGGSALQASWRPVHAAGVQVQTLLVLLLSQASGVAVKAIYQLLSIEAVGVAVNALISGTVIATQAAGVAISTLANLGVFKQLPAARIVQITIALAGSYGATAAAASHPSGSTDWATPANATGPADGSNATVAGQLLSAVDAVLTLSYAALANKAALTITQVQLRFTASFTKSALLTPSMVLRYSLNGGTNYTALQTITASASGPFVFDITAAVAGNWNNLQSLKTQLEFIAATADSTSSATCDAVELLVTASTTQAP